MISLLCDILGFLQQITLNRSFSPNLPKYPLIVSERDSNWKFFPQQLYILSISLQQLVKVSRQQDISVLSSTWTQIGREESQGHLTVN